jgi:hypothetical protein
MGFDAAGVAVFVTADVVVGGAGVFVHPTTSRAITTAADTKDIRVTMFFTMTVPPIHRLGYCWDPS